MAQRSKLFTSKTGGLFTTLAASLMMQSARSCVQVDLESISNTNGVITDSQTQEDELFVWFGINADVMITW